MEWLIEQFSISTFKCVRLIKRLGNLNKFNGSRWTNIQRRDDWNFLIVSSMCHTNL